MESSDVVAVLLPVANENNSDYWSDLTQGITTSFKVLCCCKGGVAAGATLRLRHFLYTRGAPPNGGQMINFLVVPPNYEVTSHLHGKTPSWKFEDVHPEWLAFLKKAPDGSFVPTSGRMDPAYSFRELHEASIFDPTNGFNQIH